MTRRFRSKKSIWLGIIVWIPLIALFSFLYRPAFVEGEILETIIHTSIWFTTFLIIGTLWFGISYIITDDHLIIKIGPLVERKIKIDELISAERSYSLLASPTVAFKRLKICYDHYSVLISPTNEAEFLKLLKDKNPNFQVYNLKNTSKIW